MSADVKVGNRTMRWDEAMGRAKRLEWWTVATAVLTVAAVAAVSGQSQAMKAAWLEDTLSLLPPLAFLVAARRIRRRPDPDHPYGYHRAVGVGHLVASVALLAMGAYLVVDSLMKLISGERAPIGLIVVAGQAIWAGWPMVLVMVVTAVPPIVLGHLKMRYAEPLHDKVLFADADMNKANWQSGMATLVGVLGLGIGWWWADAAAAMVVSIGIIHDGVRNVGAAIGDLSDVRARTYDGRGVHPLVQASEEIALARPWVRSARVRMRDLGHILHAEMFVVPADGTAPGLDELADLRETLIQHDPKLADIVVVPVREMPEIVRETYPIDT